MSVTESAGHKLQPIGPVVSNERLLEAVLRLTPSAVQTDVEAASAIGVDRVGLGDMWVWMLADDWLPARQLLNGWLRRLVGSGKTAKSNRKGVLAEINGVLFAHPINARVGESGLELDIPRTVTAACAVALLPFLLPGGWPTTRLGQCRYRQCGRWFLRPPPQRGTVAEYCCRTHANNERQARSRAKTRRKSK
jgi:hypothetical protein